MWSLFSSGHTVFIITKKAILYSITDKDTLKHWQLYKRIKQNKELICYYLYPLKKNTSLKVDICIQVFIILEINISMPSVGQHLLTHVLYSGSFLISHH